MFGLIQKFKCYRAQFGWRGYLLAIRTRLARRPFVASVKPPGFSHQLRLRFKTTDTPTFWKIFQEGEYDFPLTPPPSFIIDAGANVGFASLFFARKYPKAQIIALEPEAQNFALLQENVRAYPNVRPVRAALWKTVTTLNVVDPGLGPWAFQMQEKEGPAAGKIIDRVPAYTVDYLMREAAAQEVSLLKIDVEGGEQPVFENSSSWIHCVRAIMVELHDHIAEGASTAFDAATKEFTSKEVRGETTFVAR